QPQRVTQQRRGGRRITASERLTTLLSQRPEPVKIKLAVCNAQQVPVRARHQHAIMRGWSSLAAPVFKQLAKPVDVTLKRLVRAARRLLAPKSFEQPVDRYRLVGVQQQQRQQRAWFLAAQLERAATNTDVQRTQNPIVHAPSVPFGGKATTGLPTICDRSHASCSRDPSHPRANEETACCPTTPRSPQCGSRAEPRPTPAPPSGA